MRVVLSQEDADPVLNIRMVDAANCDELIWHWTRDRTFSSDRPITCLWRIILTVNLLVRRINPLLRRSGLRFGESRLNLVSDTPFRGLAKAYYRFARTLNKGRLLRMTVVMCVVRRRTRLTFSSEARKIWKLSPVLLRFYSHAPSVLDVFDKIHSCGTAAWFY